MKKRSLIFFLLLALFITGCNLGNNPTARVEEYLGKYQMLENDIEISYVQLIGDVEIDDDLKERYEKVIQHQYRNLSYEIKEEKIDGDTATVTTEIEVADFKKILEDNRVDDNTTKKIHQNVLKKLEKASEKVTYTIDFIVKKNKEGTWTVEKLEATDQNKLLGMS